MSAPRSGRGVLIVLEGIDGAGKSSVARRLASRWRSRGIPVVRRREPSNPALGRAAVNLAGSDAWASALLFSLDRLMVRDRVETELSRGRVVLQDRSYLSTLAYQADRLAPSDRRRIEALQRGVAVVPDRVIWLDLPPADALRRVRVRGKPRAGVERAKFLARVRSAYGALAQRPRWIRLDATLPLRDVVDAADRQLGPIVRTRVARRGPRR